MQGILFTSYSVSVYYLLFVSLQFLERKMSSILPTFRVNTHAHPTIGTHTASQDGVYEITFDNMYSRWVLAFPSTVQSSLIIIIRVPSLLIQIILVF